MKYLINSALFLFAVHACPERKDSITNLTYMDYDSKGDAADHPCMYSGYALLDKETNAHMFYWLFTTRNNTDRGRPLVIWFNSSPGASAVISVFSGIGPLRVERTGNSSFSIQKAPSSWLDEANLLFFDWPVGSGFSYGNYKNDKYPRISSDLWGFIAYFHTLHPDVLNNGLILAGESYAAKFIPSFAKEVIA